MSPTCRVIRGGLPPVIRDELFCQLVGRDVEPAAGVVTSLDADVGDRQEKCVHVSGDETALPQQLLEVEKETYLSFGGRRAGDISRDNVSTVCLRRYSTLRG